MIVRDLELIKRIHETQYIKPNMSCGRLGTAAASCHSCGLVLHNNNNYQQFLALIPAGGTKHQASPSIEYHQRSVFRKISQLYIISEG